MEAVEAVMVQHGLSPEQQALEWLRVGRSRPEGQWLEACLERAEALGDYLRREGELLARLGATAQSLHTLGRTLPPVETPAERHFEWLGDMHGIVGSVLADGIRELAAIDCISADSEQQAALRRGLGLLLNPSERSSRAPWVVWNADLDMLHYLIDSLWRMQLIHCAGGEREKWRTLSGFVVHRVKGRLSDHMRNNRCQNERKRATIDRAILHGLRSVMPAKR